MDFFVGFLGVAIRWFFVYKCDKKKMNEIRKNDNAGEEHAKDMQAGFYGVIVLAIMSILIAILTGNVSAPRDTIQVEK